MTLAIAVETTDNSKTGPVSATYASQRSCPDDCPFLHSGCYGEHGYTGYVFRRLSKDERAAALQIARAEAAAIDTLTGDRLLRLHVTGDAKTIPAVGALAAACYRYSWRGMYPRRGKKTWTFTHAWRRVARSYWGASVSVLASTETPEGAVSAMRAGYAACIVVGGFQRQSVYEIDGVKVLPCPHQTRGIQCRDCKLCLDDVRLLKAGIVIAFEAHGNVAGPKARRVLASLL